MEGAWLLAMFWELPVVLILSNIAIKLHLGEAGNGEGNEK